MTTDFVTQLTECSVNIKFPEGFFKRSLGHHKTVQIISTGCDANSYRAGYVTFSVANYYLLKKYTENTI